MKESRKTAIIAGTAILLMALVAGFTYGFAHNTLVNPENQESTYQNIINSNLLFRSEVLGWIVILLLDILVAWALYVFFKKQDANRSLLTGWLRLVYAAMLGVAMQNLVQLFNIHEMNINETMNRIKAFENMWSLSLIVFGFHLLELGQLVLKSSASKIFGILLVLAALSYLFINISKTLFGNTMDMLAVAETILSIPMAIGEIAFAVWLVIKGGKG